MNSLTHFRRVAKNRPVCDDVTPCAYCGGCGHEPAHDDVRCSVCRGSGLMTYRAAGCDLCGGMGCTPDDDGRPATCPECGDPGRRDQNRPGGFDSVRTTDAPTDAELDAAWALLQRGRRRSQTPEGRDLKSIVGLLTVAARLAHAIAGEYPVGPDLARNLAGVEWAARTAAESLTADGRAVRPELEGGSFSADVRRLADELALTECDEPTVVR